MTAVAILHRDEIIHQVREGVALRLIADGLNVTPAAISQHLASDPEYRQAREHGAEIRLEDKYQEIDAADDTLKLARAREGFRAAAWFAEREFPHRWGVKQELTHVASGPLINVVLSHGATHTEQKPVLEQAERIDDAPDHT